MRLLAYVEGSKEHKNLSIQPANQEEVKASWLRLLSLPRKVNPALDFTGRNCQVGQTSDKLWFLQSTLGGSVSRACTIPPGRPIICNVLSCELSDPELSDEEHAEYELEQRTKAALDKVDPKTLNFEVDNDKRVIDVNDWKKYKVQTPTTYVVLPYNNLFRVRPGLTRFASYGFYVKLTGLHPGHHTLFFGGVIPGPDKVPTFETSATYSLNQL